MSNDAPITPAYTMHPKMRRRLRSYRIRSAARRWLRGFFRRFRQAICRHGFRLADLTNTGIPQPAKPTENAGYYEWLNYYARLSAHPANSQRVRWPCAKCGKVFFAHCGLEIMHTHGPILPPPNNPVSHGLSEAKDVAL
ncbi:MAG: hypothetical protein Q8M02_10550 [Candidatus Didemnitutus sp.]|nr:hypothetical protein [Candidatus Didemnitutus sp.]